MYLWRLLYYWTPNQCAIQKSEAYLYAGGIIFCSGVTVMVLHPYMMAVMHVGMKIRIACCSLIYRKVSVDTYFKDFYAVCPVRKRTYCLLQKRFKLSYYCQFASTFLLDKLELFSIIIRVKSKHLLLRTFLERFS